ncbi:MAG TPA: pitrilysin family protein, partial [Kofleriaceae bacterium]|nr:pitrilysin family protein [Kofleriaceae bacterium]
LGEGAVRRFRADSGLRLIVLRDPAAPIVSFQTWYRVGSRHEQPGLTGMAHLFEHLMFGRTESLAAGELDRMIEAHGGDSNAATWVDWTFYRISLPSDAIELAVRIEADRMAHLVLGAEELESEREVVMNERRERVDDDVDGFLSEELFRAAFTVHPYRWPTIGWMEDLEQLALPEVQRFYRTYYAPNNATLVVVGDFAEERLLDLVEARYRAIAPADIPAPAAIVEPPLTAERRLRFPRPVQGERLLVGWRSPAQAEADWAALDVIDKLLTGGPSSRLYKRLVIDEELASAVDGGPLPFRDPSLYEMSVHLTREASADRVLAVIDDELARLRAEPAPAAELAKVHSCVETDFWSALTTVDGKAEALGHYETTLGDFAELFAMADRLAAVDAAAVTAAAARWLDPGRRTVVIAEPLDGDE